MPSGAGLRSTGGCPDRDADGVADTLDSCPDVQGDPAHGGCPPDGDGDGLADAEDRCPEQSGTPGLRGCPDGDGDGLADRDDRCPTVPGLAADAGCPPPDRDGDGVVDAQDDCPDEAGVAARKGCPEPKVTVTATKLDISEKVFFETGRAVIERGSYGVLDAVAAALVAHPEILRVRVEGHTDDIGTAATKRTLSQRRAASVCTYLSGKGVDAARLDPKGLADTVPLALNTSDEGRAKNRRVEFVIVQRADIPK